MPIECLADLNALTPIQVRSKSLLSRSACLCTKSRQGALIAVQRLQ